MRGGADLSSGTLTLRDRPLNFSRAMRGGADLSSGTLTLRDRPLNF